MYRPLAGHQLRLDGQAAVGAHLADPVVPRRHSVSVVTTMREARAKAA